MFFSTIQTLLWSLAVISEMIKESYTWNCPFRVGGPQTVQLINPFMKFQMVHEPLNIYYTKLIL